MDQDYFDEAHADHMGHNNPTPTKLEEVLDKAMSNAFTQGYDAGRNKHNPDSFSPVIAQAKAHLKRIIEGALPEKKDISHHPKRVTVSWIEQSPHEAVALANKNGYNQALDDVRQQLEEKL